MSHKSAKRARRADRTLIATARSRPDLMNHLTRQLGLLRRRAASFDAGFEDEALHLALVLRVLLHDTNSSHSLLGQLGVKHALHFVDTANPIDPSNLLPTEGLLMLKGDSSGVTYIAPLGDGVPERYRRTKGFDLWWHAPVSKTKDRRLFSRYDYVVRIVANREGGAHLDPTPDPDFDDFVRGNPFGWVLESGEQPPQRPAGNEVLASVRQIAYEVDQTLTALEATPSG